MPRRRRSHRNNIRTKAIQVRFPPDPSTKKGSCHWCGKQLWNRNGTPVNPQRKYCRPKDEGRNCRYEISNAFVFTARQALEVTIPARDRQCVDCRRYVGLPPNRLRWDADHDIPLWEGGAHSLENLRIRCVDCHKIKTSKEASRRAIARRS